MRRNALALSSAIAALLGTLPICARAAGGETCAGATAITTLPFIDASESTCGFENDFTNTGPAACADLPGTYPGPDVFYRIVLGTGNNVAFSLTMPSGATGDLALFLIDQPSCSSPGKCAGNSVDVNGAGQGPERIKSASYPPGTYYVVVDSSVGQGMSASCGAYTLSVNGTVGTVPPNLDAGAATDAGAPDTGAGGASNGGTGGGGTSGVPDASTDAGSMEAGGTGAGGAGAGGETASGGATSSSGGAAGASTGGTIAITDAGLAGGTADASTSSGSSGSSGCGCTIDASGRAAPAGLSAVALALAACARRRRRGASASRT